MTENDTFVIRPIQPPPPISPLTIIRPPSGVLFGSPPKTPIAASQAAVLSRSIPFESLPDTLPTHCALATSAGGVLPNSFVALLSLALNPLHTPQTRKRLICRHGRLCICSIIATKTMIPLAFQLPALRTKPLLRQPLPILIKHHRAVEEDAMLTPLLCRPT